jgi:uncharacterized membrane protein YhaH (DUF805 family)
VTFLESIRTCFVKYLDFKSCATRSEFWQWVLFILVAVLSLGVISDEASMAFTLATLLPSLAVTARRLHDTDRSGWLQLVVLIPILGWILLIVACAQEGRYPNRFQCETGAEVYGPSPEKRAP